MLNEFSRTQMILGEQAMQKLASSRVAVFGIGGVGGHAVEALVRSGIGALDLIDDDRICITNINRQIYATHKTIGKFKTDVAAERIAEINPECKVVTHKKFFLPECEDEFDFGVYDYVIDAIDTVTGKLTLVKKAKAAHVPIISSMGAGNKLDPTAFEVTDIYKTSVCPLAKTMRRELKRMGIDSLKVVYSKEEPRKVGNDSDDSPAWRSDGRNDTRKVVPGSVSFVPSVVGLIIAGEVIKDLTGIR